MMTVGGIFDLLKSIVLIEDKDERLKAMSLFINNHVNAHSHYFHITKDLHNDVKAREVYLRETRLRVFEKIIDAKGLFFESMSPFHSNNVASAENTLICIASDPKVFKEYVKSFNSKLGQDNEN